MKFQKGKSGNPTGRPKGAKNKVTSRIQDAITSIIEENIPRLQDDLDSLEPNERIKAMAGLISYVIPKQQAVKSEISDDREQIVIANMSSASIATLETIKRIGLNGLAGEQDI